MPTVTEVFNDMPNRVKADRIAGVNTTIQFDLGGDEPAKWALAIADGAATVIEGGAESAAATIIMDSADFVAMYKGELNAMAAFMSGKIRVDGDLNTVMQLQAALGL